MSLFSFPWKPQPGRNSKRGVGSKTEGLRQGFWKIEKSRSLPLSLLCFISSQVSPSNFKLPSPAKCVGDEYMFLGISRFPRLYPWRHSPFNSSALLLLGQRHSRRGIYSWSDPNSRITHCLPGIAILLPSPLGNGRRRHMLDADAGVILSLEAPSQLNNRWVWLWVTSALLGVEPGPGNCLKTDGLPRNQW